MNTNSERLQDRAVLSRAAAVERNRRVTSSPLERSSEALAAGEGVSCQALDNGVAGEGLRSTVMSSSCGDEEGRVLERACPPTLESRGECRGCGEILHELSNVMTAVVTNAQVLSWKLPPYSHLKRPVREMERGAQRSSELLRRLILRCTEEE